MPGPFDPSAASAATAPPPPGLGFSVYSEKVDLDVDFAERTLSGRAEITVQPHSKGLKHVKLNLRQAHVKQVQVEGRMAEFRHDDPHSHIYLSERSTVHHHRILRQKVEKHLEGECDDDLVLKIPDKVQIRELGAFTAESQNLMGFGSLVETPALRTIDDNGPVLTPLKIVIDYEIKNFRDGLHFVGLEEGDTRYPHVYTRNTQFPGTASCLFPCVDDGSSRCVWDISIRYPRTLGDIYRNAASLPLTNSANGVPTPPLTQANGLPNGVSHDSDVPMPDVDENPLDLSEEDKALELSVICSGDMTDDIVDPKDPSHKTVTFSCASSVAPQHIAFAIGPFEHVDLSDLRESDDDEMMGQAAIRVHGFCLPGRNDEVRNTCMALAKATDHFSKTYISYPFTSYKVIFVDDLTPDIAHAASLSLCSNSLLFPEDIMDPLIPVTRKLVHALASQWIGVNVIPKGPQDWWVIYAVSHFMADDFMEQLCGRNEHRFRMKTMADKVVQLDANRPSLQDLGEYLALDPSEVEFMELKAPLVMFILNQKIKRMAKMGVAKVIYKVLLQAKTGKLQNGTISTEDFTGIVDKYLESKPIPDFWRQWVYGAGCPHFFVTQRFNKKKSVIEFAIRQTQGEKGDDLDDFGQEVKDLDPTSFMKEIKEGNSSMEKKKPKRVFTGAMTITVHEADGTPYDHVVPIHDSTTRFDAPYNTKYTRLKRSRRQKERAAAAAGIDISGDGEVQDDVLLYCLGDILDAEQDVQTWKFADWSPEDENAMNQENYEWIRMDADFEWICKITFAQPHYMYVSQLQQDPDVVAQVESVQYLMSQRPHPLISTILTRTLMDHRYFHGVRTMAADGIARCAVPFGPEIHNIGLFHLQKAFQELFCLPDSPMVRSNDFSNRNQYLVQCAIPRAIAKFHDENGKGHMLAKRWILDKLKFNDNSHNEFSDCHYVATLLSCLAEVLKNDKKTNNLAQDEFDFMDEQDITEFQKDAMNEIERHRRLDEWIPSYQNVITGTALHCQQLLMENGIVPRQAVDFLQYTKPGAADFVRLKAMECLVELDMLLSPTILKFLFYTMAYDPSPYVREQVYHMIGRGLGKIAIGKKEQEEKAPAVEDGGLVIEQEVSTEVRQAIKERTQTIAGARKALKAELENNQVLKDALRKALTSPSVGLQEWGRILELCQLLFEPKFDLVVAIKYPKYWSVRHLGKGKLTFSRSQKLRTKPLNKIKGEQALLRKSTEKRRRSSVADAPQAKRPHVGPSAPPKPNGLPSLKLNLGGVKKEPSAPASATTPSAAPIVKPPTPSVPAPPKIQSPFPKNVNPFAKPPTPSPRPTPDSNAPPKKRRKMVRFKVNPQSLASILRKPPAPTIPRPPKVHSSLNGSIRPSHPQQRPLGQQSKPRPESRPESRTEARPDSRPASRTEMRPEARSESRPLPRPIGAPSASRPVSSRPESRLDRPDSRPVSRPASRPASPAVGHRPSPSPHMQRPPSVNTQRAPSSGIPRPNPISKPAAQPIRQPSAGSPASTTTPAGSPPVSAGGEGKPKLSLKLKLGKPKPPADSR
ncbi:uncharacterized protein K452DRAFT_314912 [Aplosporella prunicola CBS 121167]|uniref:Transcription initiation factor TFIID subunit 2 n=1 Tax=Aplosporella prunicola CBS 121167 TaxID=1176127 RepID=A0A6A6BV29_9PEZI|nr:uncharacterized protein K452DRAFT_314912 [Aplosporella prunicola CBS 121167]KAF2146667.1 hypothetical protein K452DRAFT_314912 [Aplosporella prunicola CBS 121167]